MKYKDNMNLYGIILAGGDGNRLWPLSTKLLPKYLLKWKDSHTLLDVTLERLSKIVEKSHTYIITTQIHAPQLQQYCPHVQLIVEPEARNTAAAVLLSALTIIKKDPDALLILLPADHDILQPELFAHDIKRAAAYAQECASIVLVGIQPHYPACEYGYIEFKEKDNKDLLCVTQFHEKPTLQRAQEYLLKKNMLWNSGIICAPASLLINTFEQHAPTLLHSMHEYLEHQSLENYHKIESISFDHAVLEKHAGVHVIQGTFGWSDVGTFETFFAAQPDKTQVVSFNGKHNSAWSSKFTIFMGVDNLYVIETDSTLVIARKDELKDMKKIVQYLREHGHENYL